MVAFAVLSLILAIAAPMLFAGALPSALSKDLSSPAGVTVTPGPWSSFSGSATTPGPAYSSGTWGPLIGWYLSIAAAAGLLVGVILLVVYRKDPPGSRASSAHTPQDASAGAPPASPSAPSKEGPTTDSVPPP